MRQVNIALAAVLCFILTFSARSQDYKVTLQMDGLENEELFLGYYLNGKTYIQDTAIYEGDFQYTFQGQEPLRKGMYFISKNTTLLFDLVMGDNQTFKLETTEEDYLANMSVVGDLENRLFFENMTFNFERGQEAAPYVAIFKDSTAIEAAKKEARKEMAAINGKVADYQKGVISTYPNSIVSTLFQLKKRPTIPNEMAEDKKQRLYYYRNHYWDFFDLGNPVLLRLPNATYKEKVDDYLDNLVFPRADSAIVAVDHLISLAKGHEDTYQILVWHLTIKFQTSKILGFDEVYVHIVDTYFLSGEMDFWANDQLKNNLKEKADQYRKSLIGLVAPNLVLQDVNRQPKALHDLPNKYSVIYFYDPDCSHCKKETPVLRDFVSSTSFDVGVFSVSADTSMVKMGDYIKEMELEDWTNTNGTKSYGLNYQKVYDAFTTPTIYLLDDKKEIIAKKISASQLNDIIENFEKSKAQ